MTKEELINEVKNLLKYMDMPSSTNKVPSYVGYMEVRKYFDMFFEIACTHDYLEYDNNEYYLGILNENKKNGIGLLYRSQKINSDYSSWIEDYIYLGGWKDNIKDGIGIECGCKYMNVGNAAHHDELYSISLYNNQVCYINIAKVASDTTTLSESFRMWGGEEWPYEYNLTYDFNVLNIDQHIQNLL